MTDQEQVPLPDAAEQHVPADPLLDAELSEDLPGGEGAEADLLDQSRVVNEEQMVERSQRPPEVDPADWLEQHIVERIDDDQR